MEQKSSDVHEHEEIKKLSYLIVILSLVVVVLFGIEPFV
jgi:hypothetical protein